MALNTSNNILNGAIRIFNIVSPIGWRNETMFSNTPLTTSNIFPNTSLIKSNAILNGAVIGPDISPKLNPPNIPFMKSITPDTISFILSKIPLIIPNPTSNGPDNPPLRKSNALIIKSIAILTIPTIMSNAILNAPIISLIGPPIPTENSAPIIL